MAESATLFVREYEERDRERVLDILAESFVDFPMIDVVTGTDRHARDRRRRLFETELDPSSKHHVIVGGLGDDVGGVLTYADAPQCSAMSPRLMLTFVRIAGPRIVSTLNMYRKVDALHPRGAHRHLVSIGIDPALQGNGIGGALATAYARGCDADGLDGHLETIRWADGSRPSHERFYARHGFAVSAEIEGSDDWTGLIMRRPAQPRTGDAS